MTSVVVVGGGLAGMAAALRAADGGAKVTLVEKRRRLGGLTWSFERKGLVFDNGQHVFLRCCTEYLAFLRRIGAERQVHLQTRLDVPVLAPGRRPAHIRRSALPLPSPLHLGASLLTYRHLAPYERAGLLRPVLALRHLDLDDPSLDEVTFGEWLGRHGQGPGALEALWDLVALPTINVRAAEASLAMAAKVFRTGLLDDIAAGDIGWSAVPLGELHGANGQRALEAAGVETLLSHEVSSVEAGRGHGVRVVTSGRALSADAVVVALPHEAAPAVLPHGALADPSGLGHSPIVNVHLVFDRKVTDIPFAAALHSPVQFVFDRTASSGAPRGAQTLVVSLSGADAWIGARPEELVATFHRAIGDLFPLAGKASLLDGVVSREHTATFRAVPGAGRLRPGPVTGAAGVFLAGAWCATGWPATMEGAVRSGNAAAEAAMDWAGSAIGDPGALEGVPA